jgi:hypothetical protein
MWHVLFSSFGITAAILVIGGYVLLQWQRNRHRYELMRTALEKGITAFPDRIPYWLLSLRQGAAILALGVGLLVVGGVGYAMVPGVRPPEVSIAQSIVTAIDKELPSPRGPEEKLNPPLPDRPRPPMPNPVLERWHRAENQKTVGLVTMGCGVVLMLLGIVRMGFARVERKYSLDVK